MVEHRWVFRLLRYSASWDAALWDVARIVALGFVSQAFDIYRQSVWPMAATATLGLRENETAQLFRHRVGILMMLVF